MSSNLRSDIFEISNSKQRFIHKGMPDHSYRPFDFNENFEALVAVKVTTKEVKAWKTWATAAYWVDDRQFEFHDERFAYWQENGNLEVLAWIHLPNIYGVMSDFELLGKKIAKGK